MQTLREWRAIPFTQKIQMIEELEKLVRSMCTTETYPRKRMRIPGNMLDEKHAEAARVYIEAAERGPLFSEEKKLLEEAKAKLVSAMPTPTPTPPS